MSRVDAIGIIDSSSISGGDDDDDDDYYNDDADELTSIARKLERCIYNGDLAQARQLVENLTREERTAVTRQRLDEDETLLLLAVWQRQAEFVRFLLEECCADVELGCDDETPLDAAADVPFNDVITLLIDHGADVNSTRGYMQSTPVLRASGGTDLDVVRCLVENGADIHIPNSDGETCLMRSIRTYRPSITVSQYLIEQGASVNAVNNLGDPALHYAVRSYRHRPLIAGRKRIINLLLRHGADTSIRNHSGDDALQTVVLHGVPQIIDHLIDKLKPTPGRCADLYSLVASRYVDEYANFAGAMDLWKESVSIRMQASQDESMAGPNPVYNGAVEVRDVESLEAIADDRDALYMQALICRERILGSSHYETIHWLSMRALRYAKSNAFQRGIELYKYASASCGQVSVHPFRDLDTHLEFVWLLREEKERNGNVRFDDAVPALRMMVGLSKCKLNSSSYLRYITYDILHTSIYVIDLLCHLKSFEVEARSLRQLVCELVQSECKTSTHESLLYVALHRLDDPSIALLEELLDAGADVNAMNWSGNTPLHLAVRFSHAVELDDESEESDRELWLNIIDLFLRHGAHVDIHNDRGETAADRLPPTVDKMQYITLQCLAARAIRQHGVTYHNILPTSLAQFIDLH